jgi:sugar (pentulose or hexulose) kinase
MVLAEQMIFIGVDVGTQGARVMAVDSYGLIPAEAQVPFDIGQRDEQKVTMWWDAVLKCLRDVAEQLKTKGKNGYVRAMSVTSTSGTVIPLDASHHPLSPAIMYSDKRSARQAARVRAVAELHLEAGYTAFNASSGLPKMLWFYETYPDLKPRVKLWSHAADYILGCLSGTWGTTDYTNALKTGYDILQKLWPSYIFEHLHIDPCVLPNVVPSGTVIGHIRSNLAETLAFPKDVEIAAGMTDGCASQVASGAIRLGDWNTTIGTTMVIKGVTTRPINDPTGSLYNHLHPMGYFMPGGASNTGADWVTRDYIDVNLDDYNLEAANHLPSGHLAWPLLQEGERFPIVSPEARGFFPKDVSDVTRYTAGMEGVAFIERIAYDRVRELSGENVTRIYTAGGASKSDTWIRIRSAVLNLPIYRAKHVEGAVGAAIVAASQTAFNDLLSAGDQMIQIEQQFEPESYLVKKYADIYPAFLSALREKGYMS